MPVELTIAPGVKLTFETAAAQRVLGDLQAAIDATGVSPAADLAARILDDDHPIWNRHTGGEGHDGPEWSADDLARAEAFYAAVKGKAKVFFDLLIDRPGRQLSTDELIAEAPTGTFKNNYSVAGAINGLRLPTRASGRRYPFYWWEGSPTRYAMKPSVAALFAQARANTAS